MKAQAYKLGVKLGLRNFLLEKLALRPPKLCTYTINSNTLDIQYVQESNFSVNYARNKAKYPGCEVKWVNLPENNAGGFKMTQSNSV